MKNYKSLLDESFEVMLPLWGGKDASKLAYLSEMIFDFTTYDYEMDELFGRKAVEVCRAINNGKTFDYIKEPENYRWYLLMCNMPFFSERLDWGTSIRGAWWGPAQGEKIKFQSCGLWDGEVQLSDDLFFSRDEWKSFIEAIVDFSEITKGEL